MGAHSRLRLLLTGVLALIALTPIVVGALLSSGTAHAGVDPSALRPAPGPSVARLSPTSTPASALAGSGEIVAHVVQATELRATPGGRVLAPMTTHTHFGSPTYLWVPRTVPGWLGVVSPAAGDDRIGWIPASSATLSRTPWEIRVSLGAHALTVMSAGRAVARYTVAVGSPSAPTPTGAYAVSDRLLTGDPSGPYGCCILALTATAPHPIEGWSGGNRVAIHSTPETASIGQSVSHGCMRVTLPAGRWLLAHIPLGTPTLISS